MFFLNGLYSIKNCKAGINYVVAAFIFVSPVLAQIEDFPKIANEKQILVDQFSNRPITFLTNANFINTANYPTCRTWAENDRYIIIETTRPRPDGTLNQSERQLIAADVQTGQIYWLASLKVEDVNQYGKYHLRTSSQFHADYAPGTNCIVYYDMTGHNIYLLNLNTKKPELLWHVTDGTIGDPPSISEDGSRVVIYVMYPGPDESKRFCGRTTAIYAIDIDAVKFSMKGEPYLVTTFPNQNAPDYVNACHAQVNPVNTEEISFCHGFNTVSDGSVIKGRVWFGKTDGSLVKLACPTPAGHVFTHEIWGPQGKYMYFVDIRGTGGVTRVDPRTGDVKQLITGTNPRCLHISASGDENRIVWDTQCADPVDKNLNHLENIVLFDVPKNKTTVMARQMEGRDHPRQMHPNISKSGKYIAFTVADGPNSKVAFVKIDDPNL